MSQSNSLIEHTRLKEQIGKNILSLLKQQHMSKTKLAKLTGMSRGSLNRILLNYDHSFNFSSVVDICFALNYRLEIKIVRNYKNKK